MARFELEIEHDYEFDLLGIASHLPDYRLCWSINRILEIDLGKSEHPLKILQKDKKTLVSFDVFCFVDEDNQIEYNLIDNINEGIRLIPELKQADFLLMLKGMSKPQLERIRQNINKIDQVLTTFTINVEELKSKEKLLF